MQAKRKPSRANAEETPHLLDFAREFRDEGHLRQTTAQLFERMGFSGVVVTHGGSTEKGKDIVFYTAGPLGEAVLCACVMKNDRITGNAASPSGASTILNQALQALREPYVNRSTGERERVGLVYVISPYTSASTAVESIQTQLDDRANQVIFKCGREFLKLFEDHWPDFLRFETGILARYLTSLNGDVGDDRALTTLLARQGIPAGERTIENYYVQPELVAELAVHARRDIPPLALDHLRRLMSKTELQTFQDMLKRWGESLKLANWWATDPNLIQEYIGVGEDAVAVATAIDKLWEAQYHLYEQTRSREQRAKVRKRDVRLELEAGQGLHRRFERIVSLSSEAYKAFESCARTAQQFSMLKLSSCRDVLTKPQFRDYCRTEDLSRALPYMFELGDIHARHASDAKLMDEVSCPLLITAPAGFGKSWFCRWHTLRDARTHVQDPSKCLPIYVRLHEHGQGKLGSFEETFLPAGELRSLLSSNSAEKPRRIRLYLDGLDEIPDSKRQEEIVALAREGLARYTHLQIIVTARDHVRGPWLGWLPRLQLAPFTKGQSSQLTRKWFDCMEEAQKFERELESTPSLANLMAVPLLATLIVNLYRQTGTLPATKTRLYRLFVDLLSGGWDAIKQTHRGGRFGPDVKVLVLMALAAQMQYGGKRDATEHMFRTAINSSLRALNGSADILLDEILQDGLLVPCGSLLMFSHLSFQEYLAGRALQASPNDRKAKNAVAWFLRGDDWWKEPVAFYLGSAESPQEAQSWLEDLIPRVAERTGVGHDFNHREDFLLRTLAESFSANIAVK
ncbi:MAG: hypothetical protein WA708_06270 [Acidobacteriaceae bacterium]